MVSGGGVRSIFADCCGTSDGNPLSCGWINIKMMMSTSRTSIIGVTLISGFRPPVLLSPIPINTLLVPRYLILAQGEVHRDLRLNLHRLAIEDVRPIAPLANSVARGLREEGMSANDLQRFD